MIFIENRDSDALGIGEGVLKKGEEEKHENVER
jgi:hypothetical protein